MTIFDKSVIKRSPSAIKLKWVASSIKWVQASSTHPFFRSIDINKGNKFIPTLTAFRVLVTARTLQQKQEILRDLLFSRAPGNEQVVRI